MNSNGFDFIDHFSTKSPYTCMVLRDTEQVHVYTLFRVYSQILNARIT